LADERFKNLTPLQWLFHYVEIRKFKAQEGIIRNKLLELILDRMELLWVTTNPKLGLDLLEKSKAGKINTVDAENDITPENFKEKWEELRSKLPEVIRIPQLERKKYIFPTFNRSNLRNNTSGIQLE
jgi:hypothetical protein